MRRRLVLIAAFAVVVGAASLPASAAARWSRPMRVTPTNASPNGAELTNRGVLREWWEHSTFPTFSGPRAGVWLVTHTGRIRTVRRTAIERAVPSSDWGQLLYQAPVYLADGRALRCMVSGQTNGRDPHAKAYLLIYSPSGALQKKLLVADQPETLSAPYQEIVAPTCQVTAAGDRAAVLFTQSTATTFHPARQVYLARLLPGDKLSTPVAILGTPAEEMTFLPQTTTEEASMSPTGWVAVTWGYADIIKQTGNTLTQIWQWRMSWVSPNGIVGSPIALSPMQGGRPCHWGSQYYCGDPPVPVVYAVGPKKALVVYGYPHLRSETVDGTGNTSPWTTVSAKATSLSLGAGGGTVIGTWQGGRRGMVIYAAQWRHGRWGKTRVLASPHGGMFPNGPDVTVNYRGQAAVSWLWTPIRQNPYFAGWMEASFNF